MGLVLRTLTVCFAGWYEFDWQMSYPSMLSAEVWEGLEAEIVSLISQNPDGHESDAYELDYGWQTVNPCVAAIMASTAITYIGLLTFAVLNDIPWLLALLALLGVFGFTPRRWFD